MTREEEDLEAVKAEYPFLVVIFTEDKIAPAELVDWLLDGDSIEYIVVANEAALRWVMGPIGDRRKVTYGFKKESDAVAFKLMFG